MIMEGEEVFKKLTKNVMKTVLSLHEPLKRSRDIEGKLKYSTFFRYVYVYHVMITC